MDKFISEMFGFVLTVIMMAALFLFGLLWYNVDQYNNFKTQTQQVVERAGGLSHTAQQALGEAQNGKANTGSLSNTYYHGHFVVEPVSANDRSVGYGDTAHYVIKSYIPLSLQGASTSFYHNSGSVGNFFGLGGNTFTASNEVSAPSEVRQGSQGRIYQKDYDTRFTQGGYSVNSKHDNETNAQHHASGDNGKSNDRSSYGKYYEQND